MGDGKEGARSRSSRSISNMKTWRGNIKEEGIWEERRNEQAVEVVVVTVVVLWHEQMNTTVMLGEISCKEYNES